MSENINIEIITKNANKIISSELPIDSCLILPKYYNKAYLTMLQYYGYSRCVDINIQR